MNRCWEGKENEQSRMYISAGAFETLLDKCATTRSSPTDHNHRQRDEKREYVGATRFLVDAIAFGEEFDVGKELIIAHSLLKHVFMHVQVEQKVPETLSVHSQATPTLN